MAPQILRLRLLAEALQGSHGHGRLALLRVANLLAQRARHTVERRLRVAPLHLGHAGPSARRLAAILARACRGRPHRPALRSEGALQVGLAAPPQVRCRVLLLVLRGESLRRALDLCSSGNERVLSRALRVQWARCRPRLRLHLRFRARRPGQPQWLRLASRGRARRCSLHPRHDRPLAPRGHGTHLRSKAAAETSTLNGYLQYGAATSYAFECHCVCPCLAGAFLKKSFPS